MSNRNNQMPEEEKNDQNGGKFNFSWILIIGGLLFIGVMILLSGNNSMFKGGVKKIDRNVFFNNLIPSNDIAKIKITNGIDVEVFIKVDSLGKKFHKGNKIPISTLGKQNTGPHYSFQIDNTETFHEKLDFFRLKYPSLPYAEAEVVNNEWQGHLFSFLIMVLVALGFWYFVMRRMGSGIGGSGGPGGIFNIGKSKAALFDKGQQVKITFDDVAGLDEAKSEVMEIVDFLKNPKKYTKLGGKIPKGALLIGPPGTGKTLIAKAMAGEAQVPFFSISGSDFVEMFVGVGASRVRDLFKQAREKAPCIVFIDEIDAIGRARGKSIVQGNDERESTLNQLLVEMDGFSSEKGVILVAATNRPDVLDDALLRPGRFDRQISIDRPDLKGREQIFKVHLKAIKCADMVTAQQLAERTPGFVGADIANICNEAALVAARKNKSGVDMEDFNDAIDRVIGGLEKKNKIIQKDEKKVIAYHEAGHAVCGWFLQHAHPLVKVSIIPRGVAALGYAQYLPKEKYLTIKEEILDQMCMSLGGRAAEKIVFNSISTGAYSDLESVTQYAHAMVIAYGMSEKVGNVNFVKMLETSYTRPYSDDTASLIDSEVRSIIQEQYERAIALLNEKRNELELLANRLLEKEVLYKSDLVELFGSRPWDKEEESADTLSESPELSSDLSESE